MNISVHGLGYVGCVTLGCLAELGHQVIGVDINPDKVDLVNAGHPTIVEERIPELIARHRAAGAVRATTDTREAVLASEICLLSVATPSTPQGHLNLDYVHHAARDLGAALREKDGFCVFAVRSTVAPGTNAQITEIIADASGRKAGEDFAVVSNPEFLREGSSVRDFLQPPLIVLGSDCPEAIKVMRRMYEGIDCPVWETDIGVAEIIKYVNNTYHALKVAFGNEIGRICRPLGIDAAKVMDLFCADTQLNISPRYFRPGFAYGGSCLPKDLGGICTLAHDQYVTAPVVGAIAASNEAHKDLAFQLIDSFNKKKVLLLGLSFKPGTDDLRNSPAVELAERLLGRGFWVTVHDENVIYSRLTGRNRQYIEEKLPHLTKLLVSDGAEAIAEAEVIVVTQNDPAHLEWLRQARPDQILVDLVGLTRQETDLDCHRLC